MAQKKEIINVCDRCGHEQKKPLPLTIKVNVSAKKWTTWELCAGCAEGLGDFLNDGADESHDTDGDLD